MKTLTVVNKGTMSRLETEIPVLDPDKIRVRVRYAGVGRTDLTAVRGGYLLAPPRPFRPGYEFMGRVEEVGARVTGWTPGQRVAGMLLRMGAYTELLDLEPQWAVPLPFEVSDEAAALLPLNYLTALALMEKSTKLKIGAKLLIHGASGGVGQAVLELAALKGLKAFGTASVSKHPSVIDLGGRPLDRNGDWVGEARELVPEGFDAVFDPHGVASFKKSWTLLSPGGTLVGFGFVPNLEGGFGHYLKGLLYLGGKLFYPHGKKAAVCGLPDVIRQDPAWYQSSFQGLLKGVREGSLKPRLHAVYPWDRVEEAHREIAEGTVTGKILLEF